MFDMVSTTFSSLPFPILYKLWFTKNDVDVKMTAYPKKHCKKEAQRQFDEHRMLILFPTDITTLKTRVAVLESAF